MTVPSQIRIQCPRCNAVARGKVSHLKRDITCPQCHEVVRFISVVEHPLMLDPESDFPSQTFKAEQENADASECIETESPVLSSSTSQFHFRNIEPPVAEQPNTGKSEAALTDSQSLWVRPHVQLFDVGQMLGAWIAGGGLFITALSPFFHWIRFGTGGVTGLAGDGKLLVVATLFTAAVFCAAIITRRWLTTLLLFVQAFGTLVMFWMGGLIWRVSSILETSNAADNPFAVLFASQTSPGAGLYLGLIGGFMVAAATGFLAVQPLLKMHKGFLAFASQGSACVLGVILLFFIIPVSPPMSPSSTVDDAKTPTSARTEWKKKYQVTDKQWDEMVANFEFRKYPESLSTSDWWKEANDKTPAELNQLFPPPQQREWYRAKWDDYSGSRELKELSFRDSPDNYRLTLQVWVQTEPDIPIAALYGTMKFVKDGKVIYEAAVVETPDVSFTNRCLVWMHVAPYHDKNESHRTLRYATDDELVPVFTVSKVKFADGTEKTFD